MKRASRPSETSLQGRDVGRFRFRLEKVLGYRVHMEKKARLQFSEATRRMKEREALIARLSDMRLESARGLADERREGISVSRDRIHVSFLRGIVERTAQEGESLEKSREKVERLRTLVAEAATKKRSLDSLKDLQFERFKEERGRVEQKLLDDLVLARRKRDGS